MKKAIEICSLCRSFGEKQAVIDLNLDVCEGELMALLGVNGAGKTTTLKILSGLLRPTSGDALLLGKSVSKNAQEIKEFINISPQETAVAPNLTVRENLELIAGIYGADKATAKRKAEEQMARFGMTALAKSRARTLSGGWQRRLSIAMALISEPKILFLDEPTLGLDILARRELWQTIRELKGKVTIILTTHYLEEAEALSDRIAIMAAGRLRICGTAEEIKAAAGAERFEDAFVALATEGGAV